MRPHKLSTFTLFALFAVACGPSASAPEPTPSQEWPTGENNQPSANNSNTSPEPETKPETEPETEPKQAPESPAPEVDVELSATYVSGHLGNYEDCREQGYSLQEAEEDAANGEGLIDGDCDESCGLLNCEPALLTFQLENAGMDPASGVTVEQIALLNNDGEVVASLPITMLTVADTNASFGGELEAQSTLIIRIDYKGPANLNEFLSDEGGSDGIAFHSSAPLRVTFSADDHDPFSVETTAVVVLPSVDT